MRSWLLAVFLLFSATQAAAQECQSALDLVLDTAGRTLAGQHDDPGTLLAAYGSAPPEALAKERVALDLLPTLIVILINCVRHEAGAMPIIRDMMALHTRFAVRAELLKPFLDSER